MNSKEIKEKEGKLKDMIRSSRDQIIQYKSFLENEMAKLDVLEKQYEVYENTLKRYNDDCTEENNNLLKVKNDLAKYEKDLKDLNEIFSTFKCKHKNLNDEFNRQSKIESDLEMEKDKVNRNGLSGLF
jgi:chromosome segregation ATPase